MKRILMLLTIVLLLPGCLFANTVAHWTFNEGSGGVVHDISGNGHDGIIHGDPQWVPGRCNSVYALEFDGDDYASCGVIQPYLTTSFTVEVIFETPATGERRWLFSTGGWDPYAWTAIRLNVWEETGTLSGAIKFTGSGSEVSITSPNVVSDNEWHLAALVYDDTTLKLYLDCDPTPVAEAPATGTIVQQNHGTFIGRYDWTMVHAFSGIIDEVRISSTALSPDQFLACEPICVEICKAFLTSIRVNVGHDHLSRPVPGDNGHWKHDFKIHLLPCEPMDVFVGDSADVFVDVDTSGTFDEDENYLAIVSSTDQDSQATDIAIKVYVGEDLIDNDPCVAIYSVNNIPIVDTLGNPIDYLCLDTFNPHGGDKHHTSGTPMALSLHNYPNPFNPSTSIQFTVVSGQPPVPTTLKIYNIRGQLVRTLVDEQKSSGTYEVMWDGKDDSGKRVASGVYFYKIKAGDYTETKKMILMK